MTSSSLVPEGEPITIAAGSEPKITSDGNGFWLAWHDSSASTLLAAAYVGPTGGVTKYTVTGSGGTEVDHDVLDLGGIPLLAWDERGGTDTAKPLWVVPMCAL
jgi:hypothetical protein